QRAREVGPAPPGGWVVLRGRVLAQQLDDRVEGRVRVLGRAPAGEPAVRPLPEIGREFEREPRLPDPGLSRYEHHLAFAATCRVEALLEQPPLVLPPDEGSEAGNEGGSRRG